MSQYPNGAALVLGASGGLGAACAQRISEEGNNLALTYCRNAGAIEELASSVSGVEVSQHKLDVSSAQSCQQVVAAAIKQHQRINTLVYAVGSNIAQPLVAEATQQQWSEVIQQDLNGFMNIVQPVIKHMREQGGGALVHVSSAGLGKTPPRDSLSVAPKAAIDALIKTIAMEEGGAGIRANSVGVGG